MKSYDVVIIGGGIVGFSVAFQLLQQHPTFRVLLLEKESQAALHQTGHNSGVIHAGVYYKPESLKAQFCVAGNRETKIFCQKHDIAFRETGKLVVASDEIELQRMQQLIQRCEANGLRYEILDAAQTQKAQPGIVGVGSILVKDTGIVNWKTVTQQYAEQFRAAGGEVAFDQKVTRIDESENHVSIATEIGDVHHARYVITCAGLQADRMVAASGQTPNFKIIPFRGEYYRLADAYNDVFQHLIYPVPDPNLPFLGVHFTPQMGGFTTVGPNAVLALAREGYSWKHLNVRDAVEILSFLPTWKSILKNPMATLNELKSSVSKNYYLQRVQRYFPSIQKSDLTPYPAGVRAQAIDLQGNLIDDFLFQSSERILHTCNAPSPAATSSLPIGRYIVEQFNQRMKS